MAADGSLKFDTKINTEGFDAGLSTLTKAVEKLTGTIEKMSARMDQGFTGSSHTLEEVGEKAGNAAKQIEQIGDAAQEAQKKTKSLQEQMDAISVTHYDDTSEAPTAEEPRIVELDGDWRDYGNEVQEFIDNYIAGANQAAQHTNEFKQEIGSLERELKELDSQGFYFGDDAYDETYMKLAKVRQALADYKKEMLSPTEGPHFDVNSLQGQVEMLQHQLKTLSEQGRSFGDSLYDSTYQALGKARTVLEEYKHQLTEPVKIPVRLDPDSFEGQKQKLKAKLAGLEKQGITLGNPDYDAAYAGLQRVLRAENEYKRSLLGTDAAQKKVAHSAKSVGKGMKQAAAKGAVPFAKSIVKLSSMMKLMLIRMAMRAAIKAAQEGFSNLSRYSDETNKSMSMLMSANTRLENSFATMFAPVLNTAAPALKQMIDLLSTGASYAGQFIAALTGKSTFVKAVDVEEDYAGSLKETNDELNEKEKETKKLAFAFDDLIQAQAQGGSTTTEDAYKPPTPDQMFETVEIETDIKDFAETVKGVLSGLFDPMRQSWEENGSGVIDAAKYALGELKNLGGDVGASFMQVWDKEGYGKAVTDDVLVSVSNLLYSVGNLARGFDEAWTSGDTGLFIMRHLGDLLLEVTGFFRDASGEIKVWSATLDFSPLLKSFDRILVSSKPIVSKIGDALLWLLKDILLPLAKWGLENGLPAVFNLIAAALDAFNSVLDALQPLALWLWDTFLQPLGKWAGEVFIKAIEKITELLYKFSDWITEHQDLVQDMALIVLGFFAAFAFKKFVGGVFDMLAVLPKLIGTLGNLTGKLDPLTILLGAVIGLAMYVASAWDDMTPDEKLATKILAVAVAFGVLVAALGAATKNTSMMIVGAAIAAIAGISIAGIASSAKSRASTHSPGYSNYSLQAAGGMSSYRIPRLATGTVVPPRAGEFAAILGDNNRDTEIVSPIPAMKQAFKEAIEEMGGIGSGNQILRADLIVDGTKFGQLVYKFNNKERQRVGVRMVTEG